MSMKKYNVDYHGQINQFDGAKENYEEGTEVEISYNLIATDTNYTFYVDGQKVNVEWNEKRGYIIRFIMPAHDIEVYCVEKNLSQIMNNYRYVNLAEVPALKDETAEWFHSKWRVPKEAYLECMEAFLNGETEYGWYLCLDGEKIVAGMGVIENDFHDRKDLTPNVCAVFTEPEYRLQGIAGRLLNLVVEDCRQKGISPLYLLTDHENFYERYGWEFLCMVQGDDEPNMSRMYIHR